MTSATVTNVETVQPRFKVGDRVTFRGREGVIANVYLNSPVPLWYGARRLIHTHCYEITTPTGPTWGWVDAELEGA